MRKRTGMGAAWIAVLGLVLMPLAAIAAEGEETNPEKMKRELAEQRQATRTLSHKMMGHVNLAELALDVSLGDEALNQLQKAKKIASQLQAEAPQVVSSTQYKYGKLTYKFEDQTKHYYVPVIDDLFLLSEYQETHHTFGGEDLEEIDAGVVEVTISADLREVLRALADAEAKIGAKDIPGARIALSNIFKNSITDEEVVRDPVWAVHDNLALAQNFAQDGNYDAARLALGHAAKRLKELEKNSKDATATADFKSMHGEVTKLQADLRKNDPSLPQRVRDRVSTWMERMETLYRGGVAPRAHGF